MEGRFLGFKILYMDIESKHLREDWNHHFNFMKNAIFYFYLSAYIFTLGIWGILKD